MTALSVFFALGALIATTTGIALATPEGPLEPLWRLNPEAHRNFIAMGAAAVPLMLTVALCCAFAAAGLWRGARWGYRLALLLLTVNLIGDVTNAVIRGDLRTLIGVPIAGAMIVYLVRTKRPG